MKSETQVTHAPVKSCGIITLHTPDNYGAVLQAYALQTSIGQLGFKAEIVDHGLHAKVPSRRSQLARFRKPHRALFSILHHGALKRRHERFLKFRQTYFKLTKPSITIDGLRSNSHPHDVLICGSDQIWNPLRHEFQHEYFLQFGDASATRVAYAPSFGTAEVPTARLPQLKELVSGIDYLSCRESSGASLLADLTGRQVETVVDPTLLLPPKHWRELAELPGYAYQPYILVYCLDNSKAVLDSVRIISKKLSLPVVCIQPDVLPSGLPGAKVVRDASPEQFLGLVANARMVVTNSFHGAIFSLVFQRPLYSPLHRSSNERLRHLFSIAGADTAQDLGSTIARIEEPIHYPSVNERLSDAAVCSLAYLERAITGK